MDSGDSVVSILQDRINALRLENASLRRKAAGPRSRKDATHAVTTGQPTWTISSWLTSLQLMDIVAGCVYGSRPSDEVPDSQWIKEIGERDMEAAIDDALPKLKSKIMAEWKDLKNQEHVDASEMNDKFLAVSTCLYLIQHLISVLRHRMVRHSRSRTATWTSFTVGSSNSSGSHIPTS